MIDLTVPQPSTVRTADGRAVGYYEFGDPLGTPVIALHGTPACGAGFVWTDDDARSRGIRLIAPDRPGVGDSDDWRRGEGTSVAEYPAMLAAFADALELETFPIIGYSGGGPYALAAAHELRDRISAASIVSGAGQVGVWATLHDFDAIDRTLTRLAWWAPAFARASLSLSARLAVLAPKPALRFAAFDMSPADRAVMAAFPTAPAALAVFSQSIRHGASGVVDDYAASGRPWGFSVEEITVPVHCWHATDDTIVPIHHSYELTQRIPGARLTKWEDAGHLAIVTHIGEVLDDVLETVRR